MFVVDGSESIHPDDFSAQKSFLGQVVTQLGQTSDISLRVGLLEYSTNVRVLTPLTSDLEIVQANLRSLTQSLGITNTGSALNAAIDVLQSDVQPENGQVLVLLTDGQTALENIQAFNRAIRRLESSEVLRVAVGLGAESDTSIDELTAFASDEAVVFNNLPFDELDQSFVTVLSDIALDLCKATTSPTTTFSTSPSTTASSSPSTTPTSTPTTTCVCPELIGCFDANPKDILFVIDGSESFRAAEFETTREYIARTIPTILENPGYRLALAEYSTGYTQVSSTFREDEVIVLAELQMLQQSRGVTNTGSALLEALEFFASHRETEATPVIVVITDGRTTPNNVMALNRAIQQLNNNEFMRVAVGLSDNLDMEELISIAGSEDRVILQTFQNLENPNAAAALAQDINTICGQESGKS